MPKNEKFSILHCQVIFVFSSFGGVVPEKRTLHFFRIHLFTKRFSNQMAAVKLQVTVGFFQFKDCFFSVNAYESTL